MPFSICLFKTFIWLLNTLGDSGWLTKEKARKSNKSEKPQYINQPGKH